MGGADFVKCLLLFYGWFGLTDSSSMRLLGGPWDGLTEEDWQFYLNLYAEDSAALAAEPYANLFLNDLTHDVPACYIAAAEFDPLRDDSSLWPPSASSMASPIASSCSRASSTPFCTTPRCSMRPTTRWSTVPPSIARPWASPNYRQSGGA